MDVQQRFRRGLLVSLAAIGLASGCAAVKATQQPGKKDMGVLSDGVPRTNVIAELGRPVWTENRGDKTVDIFSFKQGYSKEVKAGRALIHGAGDVATFGLWEVVGIPAESLADGTDVQVEVTYDASQSVESINVLKGEKAVHPKPWLASSKSSEKSEIKTAQHSEPWKLQKTER